MSVADKDIFVTSPFPACWDGYQVVAPNEIPCRILLVTDSVVPSGVGEHVLALARGLSAHLDVSVVARADTCLLRRAQALGIPAQGFDNEATQTLRRIFALARADIVHIHAGIGWEGHGVVCAARRAGVPLVIRTEHLPFLLSDPAQRSEYESCNRLVDHVIYVSFATAASYAKAGIDSGKVSVVRNGIDVPPTPSNADKVRQEMGCGAGAIVLAAARFTEQKDHALLLDAWRRVVDQDPAARLWLAGEGPMREQVERRIAELGITGSVYVLGHRSDVPDLLAAADLLVLSSKFEGLPLIILEAMAAGLPAVATAAPGITEAIEDGVTGLLTPPGDAHALATAILRALSDRAWLASAASASRTRHKQHFSAARMVEETVAVYRSALMTRSRLEEVA